MSLRPEFDAPSLRQQLEMLLVQARLNEEKMQRFDRLERQLIGASSLPELLHLLLVDYKESFGLDFVSLTLVDRDDEAARTLHGEIASDAVQAGLRLVRTSAPVLEIYGETPRPWLGAFSEDRHGLLFQGQPQPLASVALLPLSRKGELIGSLHFGSCDAERYTADCGTNFLERLSAIISVCLESALTQERLKQVGLTDGLTGIQNRRYFEHRCQVEISQSQRYKHPLACMFLDIDKFKRINDTYGHQTGDAVLRNVAASIQSLLRAGDTIARYGGEEFVVLLPQATAHHAREVAERIRSSVAERHFQATSGHEIKVTISIGLAMLQDESDVEQSRLAEHLVARADKALYQAKQTGRNRVVVDIDSSMLDKRRGPGNLLAQFARYTKLAEWFGALPKLKLLG